MNEPYPQIHSIPSRIELLFQTAPDLLTKANVLIERVTLLFNDENEKNISETLANLRALSDRFANGGGNLDAMLESGKSALAKIDSMKFSRPARVVYTRMVLMVFFSSRISPRTSTVIFLDRSPLATAVVTSAMLRTWPVRLDAM